LAETDLMTTSARSRVHRYRRTVSRGVEKGPHLWPVEVLGRVQRRIANHFAAAAEQVRGSGWSGTALEEAQVHATTVGRQRNDDVRGREVGTNPITRKLSLS
jgi:hypothetical protein